MPTSTTSKLPMPKDASEFESITVDILNAQYRDRNFQAYGRRGQKQYGIDVKTHDGGELIAAQCKDYKKIDPSQIRSIVTAVDTKAGSLMNLKHLIIAIAAERDTKSQDEVQKINESGEYPFNVDIMFWDDFTTQLFDNPGLLSRYYPQYAYAQRATNTTFFVKIFVSSECGSDTKFEKIRLELKHRLSMIPFVQSFFTEIDMTASTGSREGIEQDWIDDCDYCIFMIDNANPKDQSVGRHYKRTQEQNKKCFFVFCDEESKDISYIESEQERKGCTFQTIHDFDDFPEEVYYALVNDIARVYHCYARGRLVDPEQIKNEERAFTITSSEIINTEENSSFLDEQKSTIEDLKQSWKSMLEAAPNKSTGWTQSLTDKQETKSSKDMETCSSDLRASSTKSKNGSRELPKQWNLSCIPQTLEKSLVKELQQSAEYLYKYVTGYDYFRHGDQSKERSELDDYCFNFLRVLVHQREIDEFKTEGLLKLISDKVTGGNNLLEEIIKTRWEAIIDFYSGKTESCLKKLECALARISENGSDLDSWFVQDLLIDLRNVDMIRREEHSLFPYSENYQSKIDGTSKRVVYPDLDRETKEFYQTINERQNKKEFEKPGTVTFGEDVIGIVKHIVNATAIAMCYGSLTQIMQYDYYMRDLFIFLAKRTQIWKSKIDALKYTAAYGTKQDLDKMLNSWNDILAWITEREAKAVYDFTQLIPYKHRRFRKALNTFEFFGYYFGDEDYRECTEKILSRIDDWIRAESPSANYCTDVCKFLQNNVLRLGSDKVIGYFIRMMSPDFRLDVGADAYRIIQSIRFDEVNENHKKTVYDILLDSIEKGEGVQNLEGAVLNFRVSLKEDEELLKAIDTWTEFDQLVEKKLPRLRDMYQLEIQQKDGDTQAEAICTYVERIRVDNSSETGISIVGDSTYLQLLNILKYTDLALDTHVGEQQSKLHWAIRDAFDVLSRVVMNTMLSVTDKRNAFLAMMVICQRVREVGYNDELTMKLREIAGQEGKFLVSRSFGNTTWNSAYWAYLLWSLSSNAANSSDFFLFASGFSTLNADDRISVAEAASIWSQYVLIDDGFDQGILQNIVGILISATRDQVFGVRKYAVKALLNLLTNMLKYIPDNQTEMDACLKLTEPILIALSSRMESDLPMVKCMVLDKQEVLEKYGGSLVEGIIERGRIDSNYIVKNRKKMYW